MIEHTPNRILIRKLANSALYSKKLWYPKNLLKSYKEIFLKELFWFSVNFMLNISKKVSLKNSFVLLKFKFKLVFYRHYFY